MAESYNDRSVALTPGSDLALDRGCLCPVLDNAHGRGVMRGGPAPTFVFNEACPLHGTSAVRGALRARMTDNLGSAS